MEKNTVKRIGKSAFIVFGLVSAGMASAADADPLTALWNTISFASVVAAVFGIGSLIIGVDLAQIGYFRVRSLIKGAKST